MSGVPHSATGDFQLAAACFIPKALTFKAHIIEIDYSYPYLYFLLCSGTGPPQAGVITVRVNGTHSIFWDIGRKGVS